MITGLQRRIKHAVLRHGLFFLLSANIIGLGFFPIPSQAVANQTAPASLSVSFMTSFATLNYQGRQGQNRAQTVSLAMIERQTSSNEATYALSGAGGFRIGKDGMDVFYGISPVTVTGDLAKSRLSSSDNGMGLWLQVVNGTLSRLAHKHMASGTWDESINLSLGDTFPETIHAQFSAQPLPSPDNKWILITADSGIVNFNALDEEYQEFVISGRYRGILVYSPTEDKFRQASETFTLYHGEDQFRIEQLHYAADASGNQLYPVLDVGSYLDLKPEAPTIAIQSSFPPWCVQAATVFDMLHLAMMTAAEGSTNWGAVTMIDQSLLDWIYRETSAIANILGRAAADKYLATWINLLKFSMNVCKQGPVKALYQLAKDMVIRTYFRIVAPTLEMRVFRKILSSYAVASLQANMDLVRYQVSTLTAFPAQPAPEPPPSPPPAEARNPGNKPGSTSAEPSQGGGGGGDTWLLLGGLAAVGVGVGAYFLLGKGGCKSGDVPCGSTGACCPEDTHWYDPSTSTCNTILQVSGNPNAVDCHALTTLTLKLKK